MKKFSPLVICGPSGVGKGTLIKKLFDEFSNHFRFSISCTTRNKREYEKDGVDYYFINKEEFEEKLKNNQFLEYDKYANNLYGTLKTEYDQAEKENKICLFEMNINGVKQIKKSEYINHAIYIFIKQPNTDAILNRLKKRNTETEEQIKTRMLELTREIEEANTLGFDFFLINDDFEKAYNDLKNYLIESYSHLRNEAE
ncbi:guanylate kinase [Plasmodium yoelii 17X]|uniref:Guanylate kinase n=4 Tax=Plasmodium yoelii TaxID=5861 RepID=A0AAE9WTN0_PLAYO|nr:guanylate kinase, putative [Plasmodium yoelii]EAA15996.1 guanylate kinase [Plasmodium yoelii yoelii]ETB60113.1 guanylate kinase [Plasmodium yoelii 17X]WBY56882.1 guanylate kinase [Plasmodium yoelii yoelii]CDU17689.1 guanylate kinase, putative [Plasmodium yoelii]VTZ77658.1 guanylate kinase, putative [Plasmodium yoelii]|eukprot:XP_724431.1 guanylate kinase, putative [Plasmodium yoelii]